MSGYVVHRIGREGAPVVVVDDFAAEPERLAEAASARPFSRNGIHYPGVRAAAPSAYLGERVDLIRQILVEVFGAVRGAVLAECNFSLVTQDPATLTPIQRLPHFDGADAGRIAVLHYLCGPQMGGTSFYRHVSTGFETITPDRLSAYDAALREDVAREGLPGGYFTAPSPLFEPIFTLPARYNRLAVYRGISLHSGDIPAGFAFDPDPRTGRLTVNTFLQVRP